MDRLVEFLMKRDLTKAFNDGSDARIAGLTKSHNPHDAASAEYREWRRGWEDVHRFWGKDAKWPVMTLPEV